MNSQHPPPPRRVTNVSSMLLTPQENECLFNCLGRKCITLSSAVVQVYAAERNSVWSKKCCGVACLVKDNPQRSYFIRVYDIKEGKAMWEQELYNNFLFTSSRTYFLSFPGDTCQVGLNFANEEEAKRFRAALGELLGKRQRRTEKRRDPPNGPALPMATVDIKNPEITNVRYSNSQVNNIMHSNMIKKKDKAGKRKKLTKADIGTPSNFQHIGHVGWDPNTGFDLNNLDPELKNLFDLCGISEAQLKDKETSKVIYDFIEKKGGVEAVKNELRRQVVPSISFEMHFVKPLLIPSVFLHFQFLVTTFTICDWDGLSGRKTECAPESNVHCINLFLSSVKCMQRDPAPVCLVVFLLVFFPNTPPPPPSRGGPPPPPPPHTMDSEPLESPLGGKSALLDQIREGTQLKKVEQNNKPVSNTGRDALLDQIRQGIQLKTVSDGPDSAPPTPAPTSGIVGALMEVMQKRSKAIHSSGMCCSILIVYGFDLLMLVLRYCVFEIAEFEKQVEMQGYLYCQCN
ncbi:WASL protein, partial [Atractosteus spatula]|nr:WASL protein [Atractosteus spatula]